MTGPVIGRDDDLAWVRSLCAAATSGRSSVTVLAGDAGMGKTTLVAGALDDLAGFEVIAIAGVEAEFELPFAALQRLVLARRDDLDRLTETHRASLLVAAGLAEGAIADRLVIGVALLSLVSDIAARRPLFFWIDDAQWVDKESLGVFAFVGRRLLADRVVMLFGRRSDTPPSIHLTGLPTRELGGLDVTTSVALLRAVLGDRIEPAVAERLAATTGGNPLALRDLCTELTERQLTGVAALPEPGPVGTRLQAHYLGRVRVLSRHCQRWLLIAAAEPDGNTDTVARAAHLAGLPRDAAAEAEVSELVTITDRVHFRHPLIRSAVYTGATTEQRRVAHARLGEASTELDMGLRALLHRAASVEGIDTDLSERLEAAAQESLRRGDFSTRTRLLARAAGANTAEGRGRQLIAAAESAMFSGAMHQALALMDEVEHRFLDSDQRAGLAVMRTEARLPTLEDNAFGPRAEALIRFADALENAGRHSEAVNAVGMSIRATWLSTHLTTGVGPRDLAETALAVVRDDPVDAAVLSLRCYGEFVLDRPTALDTYRSATRYLVDHPQADLRSIYTYSGAVHVASLLVDDASRDAMVGGLVDRARRDSSNYLLANILAYQCLFDIQVGRVGTARNRLAETVVLLAASGYPEDHPTIEALRAGLRGWTDTPALTADEALAAEKNCDRAAFGSGVELWQRAGLLRHLACAAPVEAWATAERILATTPDPDACLAVDLVEAAVRADRPEIAGRLRDGLAERVAVLATPLGTGLLALADAVLSDDPEPRFRDAVETLATAHAPMFHARTHLLFGEWLRRQRRRSDATLHLQRAADLFDGQKATSWHARAARELAPLGVTTLPTGDRTTVLTSQEAAIANLAGSATNQEIADQLFLSPSTVDYHLRKVFRKLNVTSRRQLAAVLDRT